MTSDLTCAEAAHARSEGGYRFWLMYTCGRPVKVEARVNPFSPIPEWRPVCGIHARRYAETRPLR